MYTVQAIWLERSRDMLESIVHCFVSVVVTVHSKYMNVPAVHCGTLPQIMMDWKFNCFANIEHLALRM